MKRTFTLLAATALFVVAAIPAQAEMFGNVGVHFDVTRPQGEFLDHVDDTGFGGSVNGMLKLGVLPVKLGLEAGFSQYGSEERTEPLSSTIPDLTVRVKNTNNIVTGHFLARFQPPIPLMRMEPYVDGLIGFNYLYTETKIEDVDSMQDVVSSTNADDFTMSYGVAGGVMFKMIDLGPPVPGTPIPSLYFDLRVRYLFGGEAEYLKEGSIARTNGSVDYEYEQSRTDMLQYQIGLVLSF